jgi:hypothetical protein
MRSLTASEVSVVHWFADRVDPSLKQSLLTDLHKATAEESCDEHLMIRFEIEGYTRPPFRFERLVPVDAAVLDADCATLDVTLSLDENGRLYKLEVLRFEKGPVLRPDWTSLRERRKDEVLRLNEPDDPLKID